MFSGVIKLTWSNKSKLEILSHNGMIYHFRTVMPNGMTYETNANYVLLNKLEPQFVVSAYNYDFVQKTFNHFLK